jgi:Subtilase family
MRIDKSRVIIGFKPNLCDLDNVGNHASAEAKAWYQLTKAGYPKLPGLLNVVRRLKYLNAVLILIDPAEIDEFRRIALQHDPIQYCDLNYALKPADLSETVATTFRCGTPLGRVVRQIHVSRFSNEHSLGVGTRVALIDSGISPHPFLPSLSASELATKLNTMHWAVPAAERARLCNELAAAERRSGNAAVGAAVRPLPLTPSSPPPLGPTDCPDLYIQAARIAARFLEDQWTGWEQLTGKWITAGRSGTRPGLPCHPCPFGQFRYVSPLSRSFLDGALSFGINDVLGHGTQMASFIAGLPPSTNTTDAANLPDIRADQAGPFDLDVVGVAPYAEIVVLKCANKIDEADKTALDGWMLTALDALTYVLDHGADVVYFGFAIHDCDPRTVNAANGLLAKLEQQGCVVVAPAGNEPQFHALAFPAAASSVRAIAAVTIDPNDRSVLSRADYSAGANAKYLETVAYSAFGGDRNHPVLTPNIDFGYRAVWGTSVAAAIAAGAYAGEIGAEDFRARQGEYDNFVGTSGQISVPAVRAHMAAWKPTRRALKDLDAVLKSRVGACNEFADPDADRTVGAGVIRI